MTRPVACVILAAGRGTRFGSDKRRAEGPWGGPLLHHVLSLYRPLFQRMAVVIGPDDPFGAEACVRFSIPSLVNPEAEKGMGGSLAIGARWLMKEGSSCAVIGLADMPWILADTIAAVAVSGLKSGRPVAPAYRGEIGFPRALPAVLFPSLARLSGDKGASAVVDWSQALWLECDDPGVLQDIDRPEDISRSPPRSAAAAVRHE